MPFFLFLRNQTEKHGDLQSSCQRTWDCVRNSVADRDLRIKGYYTGRHRAHSLEPHHATRVQILLHRFVAISNNRQFCRDFSGQRRDSIDSDPEHAIIRGKCDIEQGRREERIFHTRVQGCRLNDALCLDMLRAEYCRREQERYQTAQKICC